MFNFFNKRKRKKAPLIGIEGFKEEIVTGKKPAILTFSAGWCGACKMQKPLIDDLADAHSEKEIIVGLVDVDSEKELSAIFAVRSIPTTIAFQNGEAVFKKTGLIARRDLEELVKKLTTEKTS